MEQLTQQLTSFMNLYDDPVFKYIFIFCNVVAFLTWIMTLLTGNLSQVDRIWSIIPAVYAWIFFATAYYFDPSKVSLQGNSILKSTDTSIYRLLAMALFITLWGSRLTYNYWRKGGYEWSSEDYRWVHVRKMFNYPQSKVLFHIFNFGFVAFLQNYLLMAIVMPMWFIQTNPSLKRQEPFNKLDLVACLLFILFFSIEIIADQQQWHFQTRKYQWLEKKRTDFNASEVQDFKRGFLITGLFKYSRHPNFFGELSIWWTIYFFSLASQYSYLTRNLNAWSFINYSFLGAFTLSLLFHESTKLTERITAAKYPEYKKYQQRVSRIIPFFTSYDPKKHNQ
jgi:steroid 5-alpha reductase family enzyme